jgi:hypothetical protein
MDKRARKILGSGMVTACGVVLLLVGGSTLVGLLASVGGAGLLVYTLKQPA